MAKLEHYKTRFEPECYYHIYNRSINKETLFRSSDNYRFFLSKYHLYLHEYVDTLSYCLLGNHFHFLVQIKTLPTLQGLAKFDSTSDDGFVHLMVSHQFRKLFQSYALAFNKQYGRDGSLFQKPFKRAKVADDSYLTTVIGYIHMNAQSHGLVSDFKQWPWSSYHSIISNKETHLCRNQILNWFGDKGEFVKFHLQSRNELIEKLRIDE